MNRFKLLFLSLLLMVLSACNKHEETLIMNAIVNGEQVSYDVYCYALKSVAQYEDGTMVYNKYTINGLDGKKGGVFFQVVDSTTSKTCFCFEDFNPNMLYYNDGPNSTCHAIDASLEITKEEKGILCGEFDMLVLKHNGDTIRISDGVFELNLEATKIILNR